MIVALAGGFMMKRLVDLYKQLILSSRSSYHPQRENRNGWMDKTIVEMRIAREYRQMTTDEMKIGMDWQYNR